jgi:hypothetical protein
LGGVFLPDWIIIFDFKEAKEMKEFKIDLSMYEGKVREVVSEAVQKKAFELGYPGWSSGRQPMYTNCPFLYIENGHMCKDEAVHRATFNRCKNAEISAADFLALTPEDVKDAPKEPEFKPFDRVLVRDEWDREWRIDFFERMNKDKDEVYRYRCLNAHWRYCIPYEGNEHLLGTTEAPK